VDHRATCLVLWMSGETIRFDVFLPEYPAIVSDR
jgi:hypothetical protein